MQKSSTKDIDIGYARDYDGNKFRDIRNRLPDLEPEDSQKHKSDKKYKKEKKTIYDVEIGQTIFFKEGFWRLEEGVMSGIVLDVEPDANKCSVYVTSATHKKLDFHINHIRSVDLSNGRNYRTECKRIEMTVEQYLKTMDVRLRGEVDAKV